MQCDCSLTPNWTHKLRWKSDCIYDNCLIIINRSIYRNCSCFVCKYVVKQFIHIHTHTHTRRVPHTAYKRLGSGTAIKANPNVAAQCLFFSYFVSHAMHRMCSVRRYLRYTRALACALFLWQTWTNRIRTQTISAENRIAIETRRRSNWKYFNIQNYTHWLVTVQNYLSIVYLWCGRRNSLTVAWSNISRIASIKQGLWVWDFFCMWVFVRKTSFKYNWP